MPLPEVGVKLVAENERGFLSAMMRSEKAVDNFEDSTKRAGIGTIAFGTAIGNLITGGLSMVTRAASQAGQALFGFVSQGVNEAAALEAQMSGIAAVTGASAEEMAQLEDLILGLGLDPNLTVSTVEAAQAIEMLAKNGATTQEILDGMALSTVQLANSTGADFATAADLATDVMSAFSAQGVDMGDAVNGITAVVNSSKFDVNDYALALANGGAAFASMGGDLPGFNALLSQTAFTFSSGATAGTALKNMFRRLVPATNKAEDEMRALGLITEDGNNLFFDAQGNMKGTAEVAAILSGALGGLSEMQRTQAINTIFGAEAAEAVNATITAGVPIYTDATQAMNDLGLSWEDANALVAAGGNSIALAALQMQEVDAADSAATRVDNFAGAMDILGGIIEGVRIQIGDKFLPVLSDLARKAGEFVEANAQPFIDAFGNIANAVGLFFENLLQGGSILESFRMAMTAILPQDVYMKFEEVTNAISGFIGQVVTFVTEHKDTFIGALKGIGAVLAGAGIVAGIAAIGGAIATLLSPIGLITAAAALLGAAWENNWGGIQEKTQAVIDFITPYITTAIETIKTWWAENGDEILAKATAIWEAVKMAIETAVVFIRDNIVVPYLTKIVAFWAEHGEAITTRAKNAWEFIKLTIGMAFKNIQTVWTAFKAAFEGDWQTFGENLKTAWTDSWEYLKTVWDTWGRDILIKISQFITDAIAKFYETDWNQIGIDIINGIIAGIMAMRDGFIDGMVNLANAGADAIRGALGIESPSKVFAEIGQNIGAGMVMGIDSTQGAVASATGTLATAAQTAVYQPPATTINNNRSTTISNRTVNFSGNYSSQPQITDRDSLIKVMATT